MTGKDKNKYPKGLDAARVRRILNHYENQSEEDAVKEYEASCDTGVKLGMPSGHCDDLNDNAKVSLALGRTRGIILSK